MRAVNVLWKIRRRIVWLNCHFQIVPRSTFYRVAKCKECRVSGCGWVNFACHVLELLVVGLCDVRTGAASICIFEIWVFVFSPWSLIKLQGGLRITIEKLLRGPHLWDYIMGGPAMMTRALGSVTSMVTPSDHMKQLIWKWDVRVPPWIIGLGCGSFSFLLIESVFRLIGSYG